LEANTNHIVEGTSQLVQGLSLGKSDAMKTVYTDHFGMIKHLVLKNSGNEADAEDVFQEAMVILYQKLNSPNFELTVQLKTYVYSICRNLWLNELNRRGRRKIGLKDYEKYVETGYLFSVDWKERREENVEKGQEILDREIKRQGLHMNEKQKSKVLATIGKRHGLTTEQDLYAAIGYGGIALTQVMPKINEFVKKEMPKKDHIIELQGATKQEKIQSETVKKDKSKQKEFIKVKGIDNIMVRFSKCCNPVPGDKISGFITRGRGVSIHRDDCLNIIENDDVIDRLIEVEWVIGEEISLQAEIQILAEDKNGLLVDITKILTELKIEMLSIYARTNKNKEAILNLVVKIDNVKKLEKLMQKIKNIKEVLDVKRVTT